MKERRLTAIMFTDVIGYTALMGVDERRAYEMVRKNRKIQLAFIKKFKGTFLKEMGDGILASFPAATNAIYCAISIQQTAAKENIPLRIGIHEGEVLFEDNDVLGDGVNIASRIEKITEAGQIFISDTVFKDIKNKPDIHTESLGDKTFKNVETPVGIHKVLFDAEGGLPFDKLGDNQKKKSGWKKSYSLITILVLLVSVIFFMIPIRPDIGTLQMERSIAVLPFDNESADESNEYFVNGMMEDIRNNLSKISDLRVISKISTEKYRDSQLTVKQIADELHVNFLLEGTVQKSRNQVKIHAQLIEPETDDHLWVETYIRDLDHLFTVQSEIAEDIAGALFAVIRPSEKEIIEKIPTSNITAYDIFLQARDQHNKYLINYHNMEALDDAIILYNRALEYDSTFARAYTGLALGYWNKSFWTNYFDNTFLDSVIALTNIALSFDKQLDEAYLIRGMAYSNQTNGEGLALKDYNTALEINPNFAQVYHEKSNFYAWTMYDFVEAIKNRYLAVQLDKSAFLPVYLRRLGDLFSNTGFPAKARKYYSEAFTLDNDTVTYYFSLTYQLLSEEKINEGFENSLKTYKLDSSRIEVVVPVILFASISGMDELAFEYATRLVELFNTYNMFTPNDWHRIGYAYWKMGRKEEADYYFDEQEKWCLESIRLNKWYGRLYAAHYDLACIYVIRDEIDKAFEYLNEINKKGFISKWWTVQIKHDPFFESIRDDERFIKLLKELDVKYQKEHNRIEVWMQEEGMI